MAKERKLKRPLTQAELEGWRQFWDPHCICPECAVKYIMELNLYRQLRNWAFSWEVPVDYAGGAFAVADTHRCARCSTTPAHRRALLLAGGGEPVYPWEGAEIGFRVAYYAYKQRAQQEVGDGDRWEWVQPRDLKLLEPIEVPKISDEASEPAKPLVYVRKDVLPVSTLQVALLATMVLALVAYLLYTLGSPT